MLFQLISIEGTAQITADTVLANHLYAQGDSLLNLGHKNQSAIDNFKKALTIYEKYNLWENIVDALNKTSTGYIRQREYEKGLDLAHEALKLGNTKLGENSIGSVKSYGNVGRYYMAKSNLTEAEKTFNHAISIMKDNHSENHEEVAGMYRALAIVKYQKGKTLASLEYFKKSLKIKKTLFGENSIEVGGSYNNIGTVYKNLGKYDSALHYLTRSISIKKEILGDNNLDLALSYLSISNIFSQRGKYNIALEYLLKNLEINQTLLEPNSEGVADALYALGIFYQEHGDIYLALDYHKRSLAIMGKLYGEEHYECAKRHNSIGNIFNLMGDYEEGLKNHRKALRIFKHYYRETHQLTATSYSNLGQTHHNLDNLDSALYYYNKALIIRKTTFGEFHPKVAIVYNRIGWVMTSMNNYDKALDNIQKALEIRQNIFGSSHPKVSSTQYALAYLLSQKGELVEAQKYYHQSLLSNTAGFQDTSLYALPDITTALDPVNFIKSLNKKAINWTLLYQKNHRLKDLKAAIETYQHIDKLIASMQRNYLNHQDKLNLSVFGKKIYQEAIASTLTLDSLIKGDAYKELAFRFSERSKAAILTTAISDLSAKNFGTLPQDILDTDKSLKIDKSFYQSELNKLLIKKNGYDTTQANLLKSHIFDKSRSIDSLTLHIEREFPNYHQLKYRNTVMSINDIQQKLDYGTALIEYFQGDSILYVYTITQDHYSVVPLVTDSTLWQKVRQMRNLMNSKQSEEQDETYEQFINNATSLYKSIIAPSLGSIPQANDIKNLIIIPDGELGYIPFGMLLTKMPNGEPNYGNLPYLLKDFNVSYGYSASLQFENAVNRKKKVHKLEYVAFAPEYSESASDSLQQIVLGRFRNEVKPLKWNIPEVNSLSGYLEGEQYIGSEALESNFKSQANNYSVIHLAMHALIDDEKPMNSKLVFTQNVDSVEDGYLYAHELYNMDFNADLAILSACNTGFGKLARGEGIMSLARAFSYAGCPSIVMSHWNVDDESTAQLMELFYKNLSEGLNKDQALQQAKLSYLATASPDKMHPRYWASFVLLGNTSPISGQNGISWIWWVLGIVLILSLAILLRKFNLISKRR